MILLDTNVLSAFMVDSPDPVVAGWLDRQPRYSIWTTSVTVTELRFGLLKLAAGQKKTALTIALEKLFSEKIQGRIAGFDTSAAEQAAELMALRRQRGRPGELRDTMIAGIALATRATLATRNTAHFADLSVAVVNPWTA